MSKIGIVILNWQQPDLTIQTIQSLQKTDIIKHQYKIYLVDNGSSDDSFVRFTKLYQKDNHFKLIQTGVNCGFAQGNNYGLREAVEDNQDYVLAVNNDVLFDPRFFSPLIEILKKDKSIVAVSPKIYFAKGYEYHKDRYRPSELGKVIWSVGGSFDWDNVYGNNIGMDEVDHGQYDSPNSNLDYISGCCFLAKTKCFREIGLFDPRYFMYYEDIDFSQRIIKNKDKIAVVPQSVIWHLNAGSSSVGSPLQDYFIIRNRLLFGYKYARFRTRFALFRQSIAILFGSNKWQRRAVVDYYQNNLYRGSWNR